MFTPAEEVLFLVICTAKRIRFFNEKIRSLRYLARDELGPEKRFLLDKIREGETIKEILYNVLEDTLQTYERVKYLK